ncbi:hypothetical protein AAW00_07820 [Aurantiacibacter luteus]|uniref:DUF3088 domain-containing protein n=1 Tax=Aurantiacibacter luteus TaxID=1581420 RepID=A0A0G9MVT3_9SPHN|nr:hypothetical protein AAW00_07820 [Aurantiacibacter luteus]
MQKDTLFLLHDYADPAHGGETFYCEACMTVEGVLATYPDLAARLKIVRVPWPRPREALVAAVGEANQNCPTLVLAEGGFVNDLPGLLEALHARHGVPRPHP